MPVKTGGCHLHLFREDGGFGPVLFHESAVHADQFVKHVDHVRFATYLLDDLTAGYTQLELNDQQMLRGEPARAAGWTASPPRCCRTERPPAPTGPACVSPCVPAPRSQR